MQSVSARIWTRVAVSIFYDDNHYTTGTWYNYMKIILIENSYLKLYFFLFWIIISYTKPYNGGQIISIR